MITSGSIDAQYVTSAVSISTFVHIRTFGVAVQFEARRACAVKASLRVDTGLVTAAITVQALVNVLTLVDIHHGVPFLTFTPVASRAVPAIVLATSPVHVTFVDVITSAAILAGLVAFLTEAVVAALGVTADVAGGVHLLLGTFIHVHTGIAIRVQPVPGLTATLVAALCVLTPLLAPVRLLVAFVDIKTQIRDER